MYWNIIWYDQTMSRPQVIAIAIKKFYISKPAS